MLWLAAFAGAASWESPATSERHGIVKFGGLPLPGATVTASQADKKIVTITDPQGTYFFPDLPDGAWTIEVEMLCFVPVKQELTLAADAVIPDWDLKLLPLDEIKAAAGPQQESPVSVAINTPAANPAASEAPPAKKSKNAPPPAANTPGGFQRTDVNASQSDAAKQSNAAATAAANGNTTANEDLSKSASDGFLVNGTSNNGASSPFATNPAFGNNRMGMKGLYNGGIGIILDNSTLDARPYSITGQDTPRPVYSKFTGTASLQGPLKIKHWFVTPPNFFISYQWLRNKIANTTPGLMPTPAERVGNFSALSTPIIDPLTMMQFPGNMIPLKRLVYQATHLVSLYPQPNSSGTQYNYQLPLVNPTHQDSLNLRLNKSINRKNQISGGFAFQSTRSDNTSLLDFIDKANSLGLVANVNWRHSFTNRLFSTFGFQYNHFATTRTPNFAFKENISGDAQVTGNNQQPQNWGPPALSFSNGINSLSDANQSVNKSQTAGISADNYWIHGRHNFQFGGDFKKQQFNIIGQTNPRGSFYFDGAATGDAFADFLLGIPATTNLAFGNADKYLRSSIYDGYITDDMRLSPGLTMSLGVRWEYWSPETELRGRLVNLDVAPGFSNALPVEAYNPVGPLTGMKYPDSLTKPDKHGFQPRLGLSWRPFPASSMLVRLGYGVNYNTSVYQTIAASMDQQAPISTSLSVPNPSNLPTLVDGFPTSTGVSKPTFGIDPNFRVGYVQTWKAEVQRDLPGALIMTATYLGIKGTRAVQDFYPNTYPVGGVNPCPACLSGYSYMTSNGNSTREAGQIQLRRRLHNGITASVLYVYSKSIDDAALGGQGQGGLVVAQNWLDLKAERGLSPFDQRHQVTFTGQYTSGMGMHGGSLLSGWRGALLKEWTFTTAITAGTGLPLTPTYFSPTQGTGFIGSNRPDYTGAPVYAAPPGLFLNPAAYAAPIPGQYGNAGRDSITGPYQFSLNASMARVFRLTDRFNLDLRVDSTNTLNHVTYSSWITQLGNPQFGLPGPNSANAMRDLVTTVRVRF